MKRAITILLAAIMILSLAACGGGDITLKDNTITFGKEDYKKELSSNAVSKYKYKIADNNIDTNMLGDYFVDFVYDKGGKEHTQKVNVKVVDKTPPTIDFKNKTRKGDVYAFLNDREGFINSIILTDDCDENIVPSANNIEMENIVFSVEGWNTVRFTYNDSAKNTGKSLINAKVISPEISLEEYIEEYRNNMVSIHEDEIYQNLGGYGEVMSKSKEEIGNIKVNLKDKTIISQ